MPATREQVDRRRETFALARFSPPIQNPHVYDVPFAYAPALDQKQVRATVAKLPALMQSRSSAP